MKLSIALLIASLCLVAANDGAFMQSDVADVDLESDFDYVPEDNAVAIIEIKLFGFKKVIKTALRTWKGIRCTIKEALLIKAAAEQCLADLAACGAEVSEQLQNVIDQLKTIISICNDIINLSENDCKTDSGDDDTKISNICALKLLPKFCSLKKNISNCIFMIKKVPKTGADASDCVKTALAKVQDAFSKFPSNITECSKVTRSH